MAENLGAGEAFLTQVDERMVGQPQLEKEMV